MSLLMGTKRGLENIATQPASRGTINGVRIEVVAIMVGGTPVLTATPDERRIALYTQRVGEKLERQGWLPDLRRKRMLDVIVREAVRCKAPKPGAEDASVAE